MHHFVVLSATAWFIDSVCPHRGPAGPTEQTALPLNKALMLSRTQSQLKEHDTIICFHPALQLKDVSNARLLHSVEYSLRLRWNERLMKDSYLLRLLTFLMTSGISMQWFGKAGMEVKKFHLAIKCVGRIFLCDPSVLFRFLFWLSQNDVMGVETIKDLFTSQGLTSPPASSSPFKAVFTICERD